MPGAILLLREKNATSLTSIVERALQRKPPLLEYDLKLTPTQLDFVLSKNVTLTPANVSEHDENDDKLKSNNLDEGFESDIDTISIVSCDDPQDLVVNQKKREKLQETDSANGSACSDTDDNDPATSTTTTAKEQEELNRNESFDLVDCSCYTDVRAPEILLFVVKNETFVFKLSDYMKLQRFYANFSALKAVANQKIYNGKNLKAKFNLLQRTDCNGVTHIEISTKAREEEPPSSIISLNTPEDNCIVKQHLFNNYNTLKSGKDACNLRQGVVTWNSLEDLLLEPSNSKTDRRKKKSKAPLPPTTNNTSLTSTSCFAPPPDNVNSLICPFANEFNTKLTTYQQFTGNDLPIRQQDTNTMTLNRRKLVLDSWTSSVPRLLKKQRSKSETRNFTPMAYRYIDTTTLHANDHTKHVKEQASIKEQAKTKAKEQAKQIKEQMKHLKQEQAKEKEHFRQMKEQFKPQHAKHLIKMSTPQRYETDYMTGTLKKSKNNEEIANTISNRLFGMSSKLREFNAIDLTTNQTNFTNERMDVLQNKKGLSSGKWSSLGELSYKLNQTNGDGSLKSVIKKDENKRRNNEKKVTFSAYTTVQVV